LARICIAGLAVSLTMCAGAYAETREPSEEIRLGVADVERILQSYWRTPRIRAELERYRTSEELRQKQEELARLERTQSGGRFSFFRDRREDRALREKREEIEELAEKDAQRAREREKEAIEQLMTDIRQSAESIGRDSAHALIFDINTAEILFVGPRFMETNDVTDAVIDDLNFR